MYLCFSFDDGTSRILFAIPVPCLFLLLFECLLDINLSSSDKISSENISKSPQLLSSILGLIFTPNLLIVSESCFDFGLVLALENPKVYFY